MDILGPLSRKTAWRYCMAYVLLAGAWIFVTGTLLGHGVFATAIIAAPLILAGSWWLIRRSRHAEDSRRNQLDQAILATRLDNLAKYANDAIALFDLSGKFIDVNDRFLKAYGYSRDEILRLNVNELRPPHLRAGLTELQNRLAAEQGLIYETEHRAKSGRTFPVEISSRLIEVEGERFVQAIIRDISERREADARILALSRLYAAISAANQAMVRAQGIQEVFDAGCRACVEYGGFRMAWVGLADPETRRIVPHASFGAGIEYLDGIVVGTQAGEPEGRGPLGIAYREQRVYICNDFIEDPIAAPWRERAAFYGFRALIALPLRRSGATVGALTAYADTRNYFDDEFVALLQDLADGISFSMDHFDHEEQRRQAESALRLSETRLLEAQAIGDIGDWVFDLDARKMKWSPQMYRLFERDPALGPLNRDEVLSYYDLAATQRLRQQVRRAVETGARIGIEQHVRLPSGRQAHHATMIVPIKDAAGRVSALHGTIQDITTRKEVEVALRRREAQLEEAQEVAHMGSWEWLAGVGRATWSSTLFRILGFNPKQPIPDVDALMQMLVPVSRTIVYAAVEHALKTGTSYEIDLELVRPDGARRWVTCRGEARRKAGDRRKAGEIIGLYGTVQDITERKRTEEERANLGRRMHELSQRLIAAQEDERRRLAAELHDRTSPNLAAVQVSLATLRMGMSEEAAAALGTELDDLAALLEDTNTGIRDVCANLRPALLDYAGLIPALENYIQQYSRRTGIAVGLEHRGLEARLPPDVESLLFRISQEALTNCAKHAQAGTVKIGLRKGSRHTVLTIADDGVGFDLQQLGNGERKPGLGLLTMRERAEFAGGQLHIESSPGQGTKIRVEI